MVFKRRQKATARTQREEEEERESRGDYALWALFFAPLISKDEERKKQHKSENQELLICRKESNKNAHVTVIFLRVEVSFFMRQVGGGSARRRSRTTQRSVVVR